MGSSVFSSTIIKQMLLVLLLVTPMIMVAAATPPTTTNGGGGGECIHSIFNFGDDISDTGNYLILNPHPNNITNTNLHSSNPSGRASNGRLIIDFMAESLGLPSLPPYLAGLEPQNYTKGANFAVIGATAKDYRDHRHPSNITSSGTNANNNSLAVQLDWFKDMLQSLCSTSSSNNTTKADDDSCIQEHLKHSLIHIGGIGTYDYNLNKNKAELETTVEKVVNDIHSAVSEVYDLGARNFMVAGLLPIGCFPSSQNYHWHEIDDESGCVFELDRIARHHNTLLQHQLQISREWLPDANIIYVDYYKAAASFINSPTQYGFNEVKTACYDQASNKVCEKPDEYVMWDESHMSEAAYQVIASNAIAGKSTTPSFSLLSSKC